MGRGSAGLRALEVGLDFAGFGFRLGSIGEDEVGGCLRACCCTPLAALSLSPRQQMVQPVSYSYPVMKTSLRTRVLDIWGTLSRYVRWRSD
jgi:hypothetical protein